MVVNKNTNRLVEKEDLIRLAILLTIALVIGTYLIATTVMIAQDGVGYIRLAQDFPKNPIDVIKCARSFAKRHIMVVKGKKRWTVYF